MSYIKKEPLLQIAKELQSKVFGSPLIVREIENAPAEDVVEVRHGEWEDNHCTACGMMPMGEEMWAKLDLTPPRFEYFMDFCPCCGAKMDGKGLDCIVRLRDK